MVSSVRMSPIEGGYGSNAERAAVFKFATEYGPCCIEGDQCMHVIVTLLLSLNTIRTRPRGHLTSTFCKDVDVWAPR